MPSGEVQQVTVRRSGGIAGITVIRSLRSSDLSHDDCKRLERLVDGVRPGEAVSQLAMDAFRYDLTIERANGSVSLTAREPNVEPGIKALIAFVQQHASGGG